jgi:hypothetical protein
LRSITKDAGGGERVESNLSLDLEVDMLACAIKRFLLLFLILRARVAAIFHSSHRGGAQMNAPVEELARAAGKRDRRRRRTRETLLAV